jgi:hypothetical protein
MHGLDPARPADAFDGLWVGIALARGDPQGRLKYRLVLHGNTIPHESNVSVHERAENRSGLASGSREDSLLPIVTGHHYSCEEQYVTRSG